MAEWVAAWAVAWAEWAEWAECRAWAEWVDRQPCPRCASSRSVQFEPSYRPRRWLENTVLGPACPIGKER